MASSYSAYSHYKSHLFGSYYNIRPEENKGEGELLEYFTDTRNISYEEYNNTINSIETIEDKIIPYIVIKAGSVFWGIYGAFNGVCQGFKSFLILKFRLKLIIELTLRGYYWGHGGISRFFRGEHAFFIRNRII